jgi:hypothetical protein
MAAGWFKVFTDSVRARVYGLFPQQFAGFAIEALRVELSVFETRQEDMTAGEHGRRLALTDPGPPQEVLLFAEFSGKSGAR